jgi:hypothetical protein
MVLLGAMAALFALVLLLLPTMRVAQGRLQPEQAHGLWISGAGFLLLALAALVLTGDAAMIAALVGVIAAVAGNVLQRRAKRPPQRGAGRQGRGRRDAHARSGGYVMPASSSSSCRR